MSWPDPGKPNRVAAGRIPRRSGGYPDARTGGPARRLCLAAVVAVAAAGCAGAARSAARGAGAAAGSRAANSIIDHFTQPGPTVATSSPGAGVGAGPATPGVARPNPALTPGALNPAVTQANIHSTICVSGWTSTIRPPQSVTGPQKLASMRAYGITGPTNRYEFDHDAPLELGGAPDAFPANLWVQPYEIPKGPAPVGKGSQTKDKVENAANAAVCSGRMSLVTAQQSIIQDWYRLGQQLGVVAQ